MPALPASTAETGMLGMAEGKLGHFPQVSKPSVSSLSSLIKWALLPQHSVLKTTWNCQLSTGMRLEQFSLDFKERFFPCELKLQNGTTCHQEF